MKKFIVFHSGCEPHAADGSGGDARHIYFEKKTRLVVLISLIAMILEIGFGYHTHSMALLADGYHMGAHVLALGLSWVAYVLVRKWKKNNQYSFNHQNLMSLSGFTSALILLYFSVDLISETLERWHKPGNIGFGEALTVSVFGFIVNLISMLVLHHHHEHHDINIRSAYVHVASDLFTSILAIVSLLLGFFFQWTWTDLLAGFISSIFIFYWSITLIKKSSLTLIQLQKKNKV